MAREQVNRLFPQVDKWLALRGQDVPDSQLLERFTQRKEPDAFAAIVQRHGPMVLRVCRNVLRDAHLAEDAFQATFLILARKSASIQKYPSVASWLYKVAYHVALRARGTAAQQRQRESQAMPRPETDPLDDLTWRDLQTVVDEELERLPERFRAPLVLCCLEGCSREEAAQQLGWSLGRLKGRLERGRQVLRSRLLRRGVTPSLALGASLLMEGTSQAAIPAALREASVRAAVAFVTGSHGGIVSAQAVALMQETTQALTRSKLKMVVTLLLTVGLFSAGAGTVAYRFRGEKDRPTELVTEQKNTLVRLQQASATKKNGDALPAGAFASLEVTPFHHMHTISSLAYSADGTRLVSGSWDHTVRLWNLVGGQELLRLAPVPEGISSVAISPDGKLLAGGNMKRTLFVWDAQTGKELYRREKLENTVFGLRFDPEGKKLAGVSGDTAHVWEAATGKDLLFWSGPRSDLRPFAFSADLKTLLMDGPDHTISLRDLNTGKERTIPSRQGELSAVAISEDGKRLATGGKNDGSVRLWDRETGRELHRFGPYRGHVASLVFARDGTALARGGQFGDVQIYDLISGKERCRCSLREGSWVRALTFSPDGKTLAADGTDDRVIRLFDATTGKEWLTYNGHPHEIIAAVPTPDGQSLLSASKDGTVCQWELVHRSLSHRWQAATRGLSAVAVAPDGQRAVFAGDEKLALWDLTSRKEIRAFRGHKAAPEGVAFSPDGRTLASGSWQDHTIRLWDVATGNERLQIKLPMPKGHNYGDVPLVFSRDGKTLFSGSADRMNQSLYCWDPTGRMLYQIEWPVSYLALSANGQLLATAGYDNFIHLWDVAMRKERGRIAARAHGLAFSPDDRMLAYGGTDGRIHLWEIASGQERRLFHGHQPGGDENGTFAAGVASLAFTADGRTLFSGGGDTMIFLWDMYPPPLRRAKGIDELWTDLRADVPKAYEAVMQLIAHGDAACTFLEGKIPIAVACDRERLHKLIADLDSDQFIVRQRASQELESSNESAIPAIRKALAAQPSAEARRRLEDVLKQLEGPPSAERLRVLRAVEVLEHLNSEKAKAVLQKWAAGAPEARLTQEARAAVARWR
jgi:RNA polymerase sigma factor (sigma-70 family)